MPKVSEKSVKMAYPPGCKELTEELSKDELLKRLKLLARAFQEMAQEENSEQQRYRQLAVLLASEPFMTHANRDVRLLVACCIADIFRVFAPDAPYAGHEQLKEIFMFFTQQLKGLEDPDAPFFKRYFYLLENLAYVKSFSICIELESNQEVFCDLFQFFFSVISEKHSSKVPGFMLDIMSPLISEADSVSQPLLDIILVNIIEPQKSQNKPAYTLAHDLIKRTSNALEPHIQTFFNTALMVVGQTSETLMSRRLYDFIYELNAISPSLLLSVLPQLEFKLKSSEKEERKAVTKLLAKMFSAPDTDLAMQNKALWLCFLGRFNDIDDKVRRICVQTAQQFIINHAELVNDVAENLCQRQHDPDEEVRMDVVQTIVSAVRRQLSCVPDTLLNCIRERTLDKKFKIRKEALMGLGLIYKRGQQADSETGTADAARVAWIRDKILHVYYQNSTDDRILVERILNTSLVPYSLEPADRMRKLYVLYSNVDENSVKALHEVFKTQLGIRNTVRGLLDLLQSSDETSEHLQLINSKLMQLAKAMPEPAKAQEHMKRLHKLLREDSRARNQLTQIVSGRCSCRKAEECVKELVKKLGNPVPQNVAYTSVKALLERIAPVMIDGDAIRALVTYVDDAVRGLNMISDEAPHAVDNGMKLLLMLSHVYPGAFQTEEVFSQLIAFVKNEEDVVSDTTLQILTNIGEDMPQSFPVIYTSLLPILQKMVKMGSPKQAKHAIRCIEKLAPNKSAIYQQIFEHLQKNLDVESPYFMTALVAIGHIAAVCPQEFSPAVKTLVAKFVVKEVLMQDRVVSRRSNESWCADHLVSEETQAKLQSLKMMVRWLVGMQANMANSAVSTLRLLHTLILHDGDLMERGSINKAEMARLRLQAGCCTLKLAHETCYSDLIGLDEFQTLALLLNDPCYQVRVAFASKLHRSLLSLRLPLQYLSIFCLAANDPLKERRVHARHCLVTNIRQRRDYLKQHSAANARVFALLPDYVLPYAIHLLAHDPDFTTPDDVDTLKNVKECLWFLLEPLITKNDNYSYSFYKKLIENIKQTKDAQAPDDEDANLKLYAVCDLALGLVLTKSTNLVLKDFPAEPLLPSKLFTKPNKDYSNIKCYLPSEMMNTGAKCVGGSKPTLPSRTNTATTTTTTSASMASKRRQISAANTTTAIPSSLPASPESPKSSAEASCNDSSAELPQKKKEDGKGRKRQHNSSYVSRQIGRAKKPALRRRSPATSPPFGDRASGALRRTQKPLEEQSKMTDFVTTSPRKALTTNCPPSTPDKRQPTGRPSPGKKSPVKTATVAAAMRGRPRKISTKETKKTAKTMPLKSNRNASPASSETPSDMSGVRSSPRKNNTSVSSQESTTTNALRTRAKNTTASSPVKKSSPVKRNIRRANSMSNGSTARKEGATASSPAAKRKRGAVDENHSEPLNIRRRTKRTQR